MKTKLPLLALAALTGAAGSFGAEPAGTSMVAEKAYPAFGSKAPEFKPSAWLQGAPLKALAPGTVYFIGCWSSVSAPAVKSVPTLNELHKRFDGKGAVVIGVSVWEESASRVSEFIRGRGEALAFRVAFDGRDDGGTVSKLWLEAADLNGIPYLFAVKDGRILWHGRPDELEESAAASMVAGTYDIAKAAAARAAEEAARAKAEPVASAIEDLLADRKFDAALAKCDELEKLLPARDRALANQFRSETLFEKGRFAEGFAQLGLFIDAHMNEPEVLAMTALSLVAEPRFEGNRDFALATRCIDRALVIAPIDPYRLLKARVSYAGGDFSVTEKILADLGASQDMRIHAQLKIVKEAVAKRAVWPVEHKMDCACGAH